MQLEKREFSAKATGEALSAPLAEIVVRSSEDPLIELLAFFYALALALALAVRFPTLRLTRSSIERVSEPR